ncbi:hypothetical protein GOP47_0018401 [Adiantum capillus-veneris]|uniref:Uncharacterized protein n=1 Tax=Adiantum capillus-veneris TaxID=13818 RepID=A0A9D4UDK4_ADICA|nr:hypothetical protein GOP47_0018401 [Adiantum capillus-veneris]
MGTKRLGFVAAKMLATSSSDLSLMKTMIANYERGLLLSVVLPIDADQDCKWSDRAWLVDEEIAHDNDEAPYQLSARSVELENSDCTEEERVAVEQLAELRRIRDLSLQEVAFTDCSCSSESSFNTYDFGITPSLTLSHASRPAACDPSMSSPTASSSAACIVDIWNLKDRLQEQQKHVLQLQSNHHEAIKDEFEENLDSWAAVPDRHGTYSPCDKPDDVDNDDDGRQRPRSRLLSEIYQQQSSESQPERVLNKRRRKGLARILTTGHLHGKF